jgi:hypothetical protein
MKLSGDSLAEVSSSEVSESVVLVLVVLVLVLVGSESVASVEPSPGRGGKHPSRATANTRVRT